MPQKEDEIKDTDEAAVRDVINMILYAFGKWGTIQGLRVEKTGSALPPENEIIIKCHKKTCPVYICMHGLYQPFKCHF